MEIGDSTGRELQRRGFAGCSWWDLRRTHPADSRDWESHSEKQGCRWTPGSAQVERAEVGGTGRRKAIVSQLSGLQHLSSLEVSKNGFEPLGAVIF